METIQLETLPDVINEMDYADYLTMVITSANSATTTGPEKTEERIRATKLNAQRMKRIDKQFNPGETIKLLLATANPHWKWVLITESWCGDGAQNIPVIAKIAALNPNIELKIVLRDENPKVMDMFLTHGSRSIPILICLEAETGHILGHWGPRPTHIDSLVQNFKNNNPTASHDELIQNLHGWHAHDKGSAMEADLLAKCRDWLSY